MTYDQLQMSAVLTTCGRCGQAYYMTAPGTCIACRRLELKANK